MKPKEDNLVAGRLGSPARSHASAPADHPSSYGVNRLGIVQDAPDDPPAPASQPPAEETPLPISAPEPVDDTPPLVIPPEPDPVAAPAPWESDGDWTAADANPVERPGETSPIDARRRRLIIACAAVAAAALLCLMMVWMFGDDSATPQAASAVEQPTAAPVATPSVASPRPSQRIVQRAPRRTMRSRPKPRSPIETARLPKSDVEPQALSDLPVEEPKPVIFRPPISVATPAVKADPPPAAAVNSEPVELPPGLSVSCIMGGLNGRVAIINGRPTRVGRSIRGTEVKVVAINDFSVDVEFKGEPFSIGITAPPPTASSEEPDAEKSDDKSDDDDHEEPGE